MKFLMRFIFTLTIALAVNPAPQVSVGTSAIVAYLAPAPALAADVEIALVSTFGHEGGFQALHNDSGNWTGGKVGVGVNKGTNFGISAASYPHEDIRKLTIPRAAYLYERDFWRPLGLHKCENQVIANEIFDAAVNMGTGYQALTLQAAINRSAWPRSPLKEDGVIGPATIEWMNKVNPVDLYCHLIGMRYRRYEWIVLHDPRKAVFFRTWVYRIKDNVIAVVLYAEAKKRKKRGQQT